MKDRVTGSGKWSGRDKLQRIGAGIAALVVSTVLVACGGSDPQPTPTAPPLSTATALPNTPTPVPPPSVGEVVWTTSVNGGTNAPGPAVERFSTGDASIFAVVEVSNLPAGAVLSASWSYNGVPLEGVTSGVVPPSVFSGGFIEFHLSKSEGEDWPDGTYAINVLLNGDVKQVSQIEVVAP